MTKPITKNINTCQAQSVISKNKVASLTFCQCSDSLCNWNISQVRACSSMLIGFGFDTYRFGIGSDYCKINEECMKLIAYDRGQWSSIEGCTSLIDQVLAKRQAVSFPDNKCADINTEINYINKAYPSTTLCSCAGDNSQKCPLPAFPTDCYSNSNGLDTIGISDYYSELQFCLNKDPCYYIGPNDGPSQNFQFMGCAATFNKFVKPYINGDFAPKTNNCFNTTLNTTNKLPVTVCIGDKENLPRSNSHLSVTCNQKYEGMKLFNLPDLSNSTVYCRGPCINATGIIQSKSFIYQGCIQNFESLLNNNQSISFISETCQTKSLLMDKIPDHTIIKVCTCSGDLCNKPNSASSLMPFNIIMISCLIYTFLKL